MKGSIAPSTAFQKGMAPWNKGKHTGIIPWNKGLTKDKDHRVLQYALKNSLSHIGIIPWNKGLKGVMPEPWNKGKKMPESTKQKLTMLVRQGITGMLGKKHSMETKILMSSKATGPGNSQYGKHHSPEHNTKISKSHKQRLENPENLKKMLLRRHKRPSNLELKLISIIREYDLPFDYVGNGEIIIAGRNPDFINNNGQKSLIEVFGTYWHTGGRGYSEEDVINHYKAHGNFKTLVIWENDLKLFSDERIADRIRAFILTNQEGEL